LYFYYYKEGERLELPDKGIEFALGEVIKKLSNKSRLLNPLIIPGYETVR
jgi:hypothetical protein